MGGISWRPVRVLRAVLRARSLFILDRVRANAFISSGRISVLSSLSRAMRV